MSISPDWLSVFIAVCALGLTIWQGRQNYKHNKLSVRPHLTMSRNWENDDQGRVTCFILMNAGLGAAIIEEFIFLYDGAKVSRSFLFNVAKDNAVELYSCHTLARDSALAAQEEYELLGLYHTFEQGGSFIDRLDVRIHYKSMYDEKYMLDSSKKDRLDDTAFVPMGDWETMPPRRNKKGRKKKNKLV